MPRVLVLNGSNHAFDRSAPIIHAALAESAGIAADMTDDKGIFTSSDLGGYDVLVMGTGFTRRERLPDGSRKLHYELTDQQAEGLFDFVRRGKGFVGIHGTGWWIGGESVLLTGGHANWHPPGLEFTVQIEKADHPIMHGVDDFTLQDEIYISATDPTVQVLASASWTNYAHPMAWTHRYGQGRVFYTTLGHGPNTFEVPQVQRMLANATRWVAAGS